MLTATVADKEELTATAVTDVATTSMTPVGFETSISTVPLMPPTARLATSPLTSASATHSLSHHRDAPMSWQTLMGHTRSLSMTLQSMQPLPELRVKKPLCFKELKTTQRDKVKRGPLWRYALPNKELVEDKWHAKVEELVLLEHHTPITHSLVHNFLMSSGRTSHHNTSCSKSGTTARK